jgi:alpha,alpha-trehalase
MRTGLLLPALVLVYRGMATLADAVEATDSSACQSQIYCEGPILHAVQMADIFNDSKVFVDLPLKFPPDIVLSNFAALNWNSSTSPRTDLLQFVTGNFGPIGSDLLRWTPPDWEETPSFLKRLSRNDKYFSFAKSVHQLWLSLGREAVPMVKATPERYSLLYTPHPMIVPGGRFRESYYWDTFWIVKGLLVSDMVTTAQHLVDNLLHLCSVYGFVPNGNRIYYTTRSQPPLLSDMVHAVYNALRRQNGPGARAFLESALPVLEKEYLFWSTNRASTKFAPLCIYNAETTLPRPESYREDVALASELTSPTAKETLFTNIAAAAESGWDFSSRWLRDGKRLQTIDTTAIVPVDLNVYMLRFECNMARFYNATGNPSKAAEFIANAVARHDHMEKLLWNDQSKQWNDYFIVEGKLSGRVAASNFVPFWGFSDPLLATHTTVVSKQRLREAFEAFQLSGLVGVAGIRATMATETGQQWDSPNGWACIQHILVESFLENYPPGSLQFSVGRRIGRDWLETNMVAFQKHPYMYEKYDVDVMGMGGGGGEYIPQTGFGWTNGVALVFLNDPRILPDPEPESIESENY